MIIEMEGQTGSFFSKSKEKFFAKIIIEAEGK